MGFSWSSLLPVVGAVAGGALGGPLGASIGGTLGGALSSSAGQAAQNKAQAKAAQTQYDVGVENWEKYAEMMKLSPEEEQALIAKGKQRLSQNLLASKKKLSENLASKNLGGGMLATGLADTTRGYDTAVGNLTADVLLADTGKVPPFQMPGYNVPAQLGTSDYFSSEIGNLAQQLGGMGMVQSMFETEAEKKKRLAASSGNWFTSLFSSSKPDYSYLQSVPDYQYSGEW